MRQLLLIVLYVVVTTEVQLTTASTAGDVSPTTSKAGHLFENM